MPTLKLRIGIPSLRTLGNLCICGALVSISGLAYMRWQLEDQVRRTEYYQMAIQQLRQHSGAMDLLGEPIKETGFSLSNEKNRCDEEKAQLQVSVHGPKDKGTVYFWATNCQQKGWLIDRLELETKQHPNKRFLLKKPSNYSLLNNESNQDTGDGSDVLGQESHEAEKKGENKQQKPETFTPPSIQNHPPLQLRQEQGQEPIPYVETAEGGRMQ